MKKLGIIILVMVFGFALFTVVKNTLTEFIIAKGIKSLTGLTISIDKLEVKILGSSVNIEDLKLFNPEKFIDRVMMDVPQLYFNYDLGALLNKEIHLKDLKIDLREFVVVRDQDKDLNIDVLKKAQDKEREYSTLASRKQGAGGIEFKIDNLDLRIHRVIYKDYSSGSPPRIVELNTNIKMQRENIDNPYALVNAIVGRALFNTAITNIADYYLSVFSEKLIHGR